MSSTEKPLGIDAKAISTDLDGVVTGVMIWLYGVEVTLDREDSFSLLDRVQEALRHQ